MKRWIFLLIMLGTLLGLTGCGAGMATTSSERAHNIQKGLARENRMLADDLDHLMLTDRPSRLTRWRTE